MEIKVYVYRDAGSDNAPFNFHPAGGNLFYGFDSFSSMLQGMIEKVFFNSRGPYVILCAPPPEMQVSNLHRCEPLPENYNMLLENIFSNTTVHYKK